MFGLVRAGGQATTRFLHPDDQRPFLNHVEQALFSGDLKIVEIRYGCGVSFLAVAGESDRLYPPRPGTEGALVVRHQVHFFSNPLPELL